MEIFTLPNNAFLGNLKTILNNFLFNKLGSTTYRGRSFIDPQLWLWWGAVFRVAVTKSVDMLPVRRYERKHSPSCSPGPGQGRTAAAQR